jgi:hypothetical protein
MTVFASILAPDMVRAIQGENSTAADGCECPASRAPTSAASAYAALVLASVAALAMAF